MAHTKQSCKDLGRMAAHSGGAAANPFKPDSWQANSWSDGYRMGKAEMGRAAAEAGQGQKASDAPVPYTMGNLAPFPDRMPHPTREHITALNARALETKDSTVALRLDRKITVLYQRYA